MTELKDFNACPIGEYVRIIQLHEEPVESLSDQELYVLYTKSLDDSTSELGKKLGFRQRAKNRAKVYKAELVRRGILTDSQTYITDEV